MARAILVAATTGLRRAELCALRRWRDVDLEHGVLRVSASIVNVPGQPLGEIPTKNRRVRVLAIDEMTAAILRTQIEQVVSRAAAAQVTWSTIPTCSLTPSTARSRGSRPLRLLLLTTTLVGVEILATARRHGISDDDIRHAVENSLAGGRSDDQTDFVMLVGPDQSGNLIEVGIVVTGDIEYAIHAMRARNQYLEWL